MSRAPMKVRGVKVNDALWDAAMAKADERDEILSEEIRAFLKTYCRKPSRSATATDV